jgi:adenosine kinase
MEGSKSTKKIIAGLGNPILDISNKTDKATIDKYGLVYNQTIFANDSNVGFYEELEKLPNCSFIPGGSVTNSIRVANVRLFIIPFIYYLFNTCFPITYTQ